MRSRRSQVDNVPIDRFRLADALYRSGLPQWWVAERAEISARTLIRWLGGQVLRAPRASLERVASILEVGLEDLRLAHSSSVKDEDESLLDWIRLNAREGFAVEYLRRHTPSPRALRARNEVVVAMVLGRFEEAGETLDALDTSEEAVPQLLRIELRCLRSSLEIQRSRFDEARAALEEVELGLGQQAPHVCLHLRVKSQILRGQMAYFQGNLRDAEVSLRGAVEASRSLERPGLGRGYVRAQALLSLANVYWQQTHWELLATTVQEAHALSEDLGYEFGRVRTLSLQALLLMQSGQPNEAWVLIKDAERISGLDKADDILLEVGALVARACGCEEDAQMRMNRGLERTRDYPARFERIQALAGK